MSNGLIYITLRMRYESHKYISITITTIIIMMMIIIIIIIIITNFK